MNISYGKVYHLSVISLYILRILEPFENYKIFKKYIFLFIIKDLVSNFNYRFYKAIKIVVSL